MTALKSQVMTTPKFRKGLNKLRTKKIIILVLFVIATMMTPNQEKVISAAKVKEKFHYGFIDVHVTFKDPNTHKDKNALFVSQIFGWCMQETPKSAILEGSDNTIKQTIKAVCGCGDNYRITFINVIGSITTDRAEMEKYRDGEIRSYPLHSEFHSNADTIYSSKCSN